MQVDGEPWRQPIPAAAARPRAPRPAALQEAGPPGQAQQAQQTQQAQQVVVHVAHAGVSSMLHNEAEPQGGRRVRAIAARGAQLSSPLDPRFSMLWPAHSVAR
jgi:hypothetical protein